MKSEIEIRIVTMLDEIARIIYVTVSAEIAALLAHHLEVVKLFSKLISLMQGEIWLMI
jgi:hypothetical protein